MYSIDDPELDANLMCDRVLLALRAAKSGSAGSRYVLYDETLRVAAEEQQLAGEMTTALDRGSSCRSSAPVLLCDRPYDRPEVLARWKHPAWSAGSRRVHSRVRAQRPHLASITICGIRRAAACARGSTRTVASRAASVGEPVARRHLSIRPVLVSQGLVERYDVPPSLLNLEITESAYMESPDQLVGAVMELRRAGFTVEMDDFGSGYSSLNTLKTCLWTC
ncbi:MAG: EAL domain-containing protein [Eggerthellaceae bacterium]